MSNGELRKLTVKKIISVILSVLMVFSAFSFGTFADNDDENLDDYFASILGENSDSTDEVEEKVTTPKEAIKKAEENNQLITVRNEKFSLIIDKSTGYLYLENLKTGKIWSSCPHDYLNDELASGITRTNLRSVIVVNYIFSDNISVINSYAGAVLNDTVEYSVKGDTVLAEYTFNDEGFMIPLEFKLTENGMDVSVIFEKIKDTPEKRINSIDVLPYLGAAGTKEKGYMVIPDGSGAIINYNNKKVEFSPYEKDFFGGNMGRLINLSPTDEEKIRLPYFGMCSGKEALSATVTKGAETASLYASVAGKICNYNRIYTKAVYRAYDTVDLKDFVGKEMFAKYSALDHVSLKKYTVSYSILNDKNANIVGIADDVRNKLFPDIPKQKDSGKLKMFLDLYGAVQKEKAFLGIRFTGVQKLTTYKQAKKIISSFKESGIDNLKIGYRYCSDLSYNGKISSEISPSFFLGGKSGFKSLLKFAEENNADIFPYVNFVSFKKNGNSYASLKDAIMGLQLNLVELYPYNINDGQRNTTEKPTYLVAASRYNKAKKQLLKSLKNYNTGFLFDESANYIYSDYVKNGYQVDKTKSSQEEIFNSVKKNNGTVMMSNPNSYALKYADYLSDIPMQSSEYYIFDKDVPLTQLILKGYVTYSTTALNIKGITDSTILKIIETGSNIKFNIIYSEGKNILGTELNNQLYGAAYSTTKDTAIKVYNKLTPVFDKISGAKVIDYESENDIVNISYDNGIKIILNYNTTPITSRFGTVKANGYKIIEKGE